MHSVIVARQTFTIWTQCYGRFAVPSVLIDALCRAEMRDTAVEVFGPLMVAIVTETVERRAQATALNERCVRGPLICPEYRDCVNRLCSLLASHWRDLGEDLNMEDSRLAYYEKAIGSELKRVRTIVYEFYYQHGVQASLWKLVEAAERVVSGCKEEIVPLLPTEPPALTAIQPLALSDVVLASPVCDMAIDMTCKNACYENKWRGLVRHLGIRRVKQYEGRFPLISDIVYDILDEWKSEKGRDATNGQLLGACEAVYVRGVVEHELQIALEAGRRCVEETCLLCHDEIEGGDERREPFTSEQQSVFGIKQSYLYCSKTVSLYICPFYSALLDTADCTQQLDEVLVTQLPFGVTDDIRYELNELEDGREYRCNYTVRLSLLNLLFTGRDWRMLAELLGLYKRWINETERHSPNPTQQVIRRWEERCKRKMTVGLLYRLLRQMKHPAADRIDLWVREGKSLRRALESKWSL